MTIVYSVLCVIAVALVLIVRTKISTQAGENLADAPREVRLAARRFGMQRNPDLHPVDLIGDPAIAVAALSVAFLDADGTRPEKQHDAMSKGLQSELNLPASDVADLEILGRWLVAQCGGAKPATTRIAAKLYQLDHSSSLGPVMRVLKGISLAGSDEMTPTQSNLVEDIKRAFHLA